MVHAIGHASQIATGSEDSDRAQNSPEHQAQGRSMLNMSSVRASSGSSFLLDQILAQLVFGLCSLLDVQPTLVMTDLTRPRQEHCKDIPEPHMHCRCQIIQAGILTKRGDMLSPRYICYN